MEQLNMNNCQSRECGTKPNFRHAKTQRGVVLFIALIVLVAMTLAGIALVRSVDTENLVAGNMAFKQAALQASDAGVEAAFAALPNIIATTLDNDRLPAASSTAPNHWYYSTMRVLDADGVPTTTAYDSSLATPPTPTPIDWSNVPTASTTGGYSVQYVVDRLCEGPAPVNDIQRKCFADEPRGGGSQKPGAVVFTSSTTVYYRATVRVTGPRNTQSVVQAVLGRG